MSPALWGWDRSHVCDGYWVKLYIMMEIELDRGTSEKDLVDGIKKGESLEQGEKENR